MTSSRILIVEPDQAFGLSLASLFQDEGHVTRVARSAGEAELEIALRRPDLVVLRAELPDLSGFSLCARLRHDRATARLPVILYSSDTAPGALAEHASTPWAANGYLAMPLDTAALRALSGRILAAEGVVESADDAVIEEEVEAIPAAPASAAPVASPPPMAPPPGGRRRPVRNALSQEDRLLVDRIFASIAERRDALLAEATLHRPPPRRDLLQSADGRLQLLRDDLKAREAQIAQLAELWEIREREVSYAGEWLHEKDVELQGLKGKVEDLSSRLAEARAVLVEKEREHGASVDALLLEKVTQEKDLIEAIAGAERRVHDAERSHATLKRSLEEAIGLLEEEKRDLAERLSVRESELAAERERAVALEGGLAEARGAAEAAAAEAAQREEELRSEVAERDRLLGAARRENERLQGELTGARHEQMVAMSELNVVSDRAAAREEELAAHLAAALRERDDARSTGAGGSEGGAPEVPPAEDPAGARLDGEPSQEPSGGEAAAGADAERGGESPRGQPEGEGDPSAGPTVPEREPS